MLGIHHAGAAIAKQRRAPVTLVVDLIEGHPVFDLVLIALKNDFSKTDKEIDDFTIGPATVLLNQVQRHFKVGKGDDWFNVVLQQFIEHVVVEL